MKGQLTYAAAAFILWSCDSVNAVAAESMKPCVMRDCNLNSANDCKIARQQLEACRDVQAYMRKMDDSKRNAELKKKQQEVDVKRTDEANKKDQKTQGPN